MAVFTAALVTVGSVFRFDELDDMKIQNTHLKSFRMEENKF